MLFLDECMLLSLAVLNKFASTCLKHVHNTYRQKSMCRGMTHLNTICWVMTLSRATSHFSKYPSTNQNKETETKEFTTTGTRWLCRQSAPSKRKGLYGLYFHRCSHTKKRSFRPTGQHSSITCIAYNASKPPYASQYIVYSYWYKTIVLPVTVTLSKLSPSVELQFVI